MLSFDQFRHTIESQIMARESVPSPSPDDILAATTLRTLLEGLPPCPFMCEEAAIWENYDA